MTNPPILVLHAIDRLTGNPDFRTLMAWVEDGRLLSIEQLLTATTTVSVHQGQGYSQALTDLSRSVTTAHDALSSLG